jgi:hypothetical protein
VWPLHTSPALVLLCGMVDMVFLDGVYSRALLAAALPMVAGVGEEVGAARCGSETVAER